MPRLFGGIISTQSEVLIVSDGSHREAECVRVVQAMRLRFRVVQQHEITVTSSLKKQLGKPCMVMGVGTLTTRAMAVIKSLVPNAYYVNMLDPASDYHVFDMLIIPSHEPAPPHSHSVRITGVVNKVNAESLALAKVQAKQHFVELSSLPQPNIAVLIGGTHVGARFTCADIKPLIDQLEDYVCDRAGRLMVTTSARTSVEVTDYLEQRVLSPNMFFRFYRRGGKANPYMAMLAHADMIVVTGDSVRMLSEAVSVGVPVLIYNPIGVTSVYQQLHERLVQAGVAHIFSQQPLDEIAKSNILPLDERKRVAGLLCEQLFSGKNRKRH